MRRFAPIVAERASEIAEPFRAGLGSYSEHKNEDLDFAGVVEGGEACGFAVVGCDGVGFVGRSWGRVGMAEGSRIDVVERIVVRARQKPTR